MSGRKFYCYCDSNCRYETMTKEQILAAIAQAAETGLVIDPDAGFISKVKEKNRGEYVTFWVGTRAQYNRLESVDKNCVYIIADDTSAADLNAALAQMQQTCENAEAVAAEARASATSSTRRLAPSFEDGQGFAYMYSETELDNWLTAQLEELRTLSPVTKVSGFYADAVFGTTRFITVTLNVGMDKIGSFATFEAADNGCAIRWNKTYTKDGWAPLEWENPPLKTGVEYRTAERHNNAPVYVRRWNTTLSSVNGSTSIVVARGLAGASIVDYRVVLTHENRAYTCPAFGTDGALLAHAYVFADETNGEIGITPVSSDFARCAADIVVKYTK